MQISVTQITLQARVRQVNKKEAGIYIPPLFISPALPHSPWKTLFAG